MIDRKTIAAGIVSVSVFGLAGTVPAVAAKEFETPMNRSAAQILPANLITGPHYEIRDKVVSYGFMHHWTIDSDFGTFEVTGDGALRKMLNEIQAIAALKEESTAEAAKDSVVSAAKRPFQLFGDLITDPVDTVSGVPEGIGNIFGNVSEAVTMEHDPSEDSRIKQALFVSSWKRDYCDEVGCDVYSSNKVLQKELNRVAWAATVAGLGVSAATMATSATAVVVLKNMRLADQVKDAVKELPPPRLRINNEKKLREMGVSEDLTGRFLDHPVFTPRHDTIIVHCLSELKGAQGRELFIQSALQARDEVTANFYMNIAQTLVGYQDEVAPIKSFTLVSKFPVAQDANGTALFAFPLDHGIYAERGHGFLTHLKKTYQAPGFDGRFAVWVAGTVSPRAVEEYSKLGFEITQNVDQRIGFLD